MKIQTLIIWLLTLISLLTFAQNNQVSPTIAYAQGIVQTNATFFDTEGYNVFLQVFEYNFDEKGINKVKKKFSIPKETIANEDTEFPNAKILLTLDTNGESKTHSIYYLISGGQGKIKVIGFSTLADRVKTIEREFYEAILSNSLPKNIYTPMQVDTIQFAGRGINLGPACLWRGIRNIQCPDKGQMSWTELSSLDRAKQITAGQKANNANLKMGKVLEDTEVDILFEGQPTKVLKRKLKITIPQFIMGGSNILIIYYVTTEVRGRYVSCVLSHYTDDIGAKKLPPLLKEVMELKE
ncbi:MAG: hypothetical protein H0U95_15825 [Bacteroidetes bacterium]|nr:hypothetical protein [Bacteroidota bacterium]